MCTKGITSMEVTDYDAFLLHRKLLPLDDTGAGCSLNPRHFIEFFLKIMVPQVCKLKVQDRVPYGYILVALEVLQSQSPCVVYILVHSEQTDNVVKQMIQKWTDRHNQNTNNRIISLLIKCATKSTGSITDQTLLIA